MRTVYSNTRHPKFVKWSVIAAVIISVACFVLYIVVDDDNWVRTILHLGWLSFFYTPLFGGSYLLSRYVIDDESDTLTFSGEKKNPMKISSIFILYNLNFSNSSILSTKDRHMKIFIFNFYLRSILWNISKN